MSSLLYEHGKRLDNSVFADTIINKKDYESIISENMDLTDMQTLATVNAINEADRAAVLTSLTSRLYDNIVDKVDDIDFGTIPLSRGDITKIDNYDQLVDCINIITDILQHYNQPVEPTIGVVSIALQNMIDRADLFTKAYKLDVEMPIIIYNTMALSIVSAVSLMISSCIEFMKLPDDQGFDIAVDKAALAKTKDNLLFTDLAKFNKLCASGEFDKAMDFVISGNSKNFAGGGFYLAYTASSVAVSLGLILLIIPVIRELIFFFYYSRTKVSDYFDAQATLLTMNAYNVENSLTRESKNKKEIANRQRKVADAFKKISNFLKVNLKSAEQKSQKDIKDLDSKKYKHDEVLDIVPDSSNSILF
jgi:hypothetical protein